MKKLAVLPIAALMLAACSESPVGLDMAPQFDAIHGSIAAPSVTAVAQGADVLVSWSWAGSAWDLVSFKLLRDGVEVATAIPNAKPFPGGLLSRSVTDYGAEGLATEYCVEVMAKNDKVGKTSAVTNHSKSCTPVTTVSLVSYEFASIGAANGQIETPAPAELEFKKSGDIVLWAVLYRNGALVEDCTTVPMADASATITFTSPGAASSTVSAGECAFNGSAGKFRYRFTLTNHFNNQVSSGMIDLKVAGNTVTTYSFITE